jgi:hypothetical protein
VARGVNVRRTLAVLVAAVTGAGLAGCGVPQQDEPDVIDHRDVPFRLTDERPPDTTAPRPVDVSPDPDAGTTN